MFFTCVCHSVHSGGLPLVGGGSAFGGGLRGGSLPLEGVCTGGGGLHLEGVCSEGALGLEGVCTEGGLHRGGSA